MRLPQRGNPPLEAPRSTSRSDGSTGHKSRSANCRSALEKSSRTRIEEKAPDCSSFGIIGDWPPPGRGRVFRGLEPQVRALCLMRCLLNSYLLHCPCGAVALDDYVVGNGVDLVDQAAALAVAQAGLRPAEQLSVVIQPVEFARSVAAIDVLGGDLDAPRRAYAADGFLEVQIGVIDLDAVVAAVADINVALRVRGDAMRRTELIRAGTVCSHRLHPCAVLRYLDDARVAIAIAHVDIVLRIPCYVGFPVECAHYSDRIALRDLLTAFEVALHVIDRLRFSAERHFDVGIRVELDDHSGTLVNHPHVVVFIDADGVRE